MASTARLELRTDPSVKALWVQAAALSNISLTEFAESALTEKAVALLKRKPMTFGGYGDFKLTPGWDDPLEEMAEYG
jgi:hypothetical protein